MDTTSDPSTETPPRFKTVDEIADVMPYYEESTAVDQAVHRALALMETFASATPTTTNNNKDDVDDDNPWSDPDRMFAQLDEARHEMAQAWDTLHAATKVEYDPLFDDVVDATTTTTEDATTTAVDADVDVDVDADYNTATVDTSSMCDDQDENKTKTAQDQSLQQEEQQQIIRMAHMDMITDAFGDVLEDLRKRQESGDDKNDPLDMDTLVDCLQSGLDLVFQNNRMLSNPSATDFQFVDPNATTTAATNTTATTASSKESDDEEQVNLTPHERRRRQLGYLLVDQL